MARTVDYRDYDRVLTLITREMGKMTATARNCRKPTSKLHAAAQLFCYGEFSLTERFGIFYVTQCDIREVFYDIRLRVSAVTAASLITTVCEDFSNPEEPNHKAFSLLLYCLKYLCDQGNNTYGVTAFFLTKLMDFMGFRPMTEQCVLCGGKENLFYFGKYEGGAVCGKCRLDVLYKKRVSEKALNALTGMLKIKSAAYAANKPLIEDNAKELYDIMHDYAAARMSRKPLEL